MKITQRTHRYAFGRYIVVLAACIAVSSLAIIAAEKAPQKKPAKPSRDVWQQPDRVVADLGLKEGSIVADVGCGSGYFTFRLSEAVGKTGKVLATEISAKGLKAVADRAAKNNITNISTVKSDPTITRLWRHSVDAAVVVNVLHHVRQEHRIPLVKDIVEAIKPGGSLYVVEWRIGAKIKADKCLRITRANLIRLLRRAGLELDAEFFYLEHQVFLRFHKPAGK
jgi:predicted methyltransferase